MACGCGSPSGLRHGPLAALQRGYTNLAQRISGNYLRRACALRVHELPSDRVARMSVCVEADMVIRRNVPILLRKSAISNARRLFGLLEITRHFAVWLDLACTISANTITQDTDGRMRSGWDGNGLARGLSKSSLRWLFKPPKKSPKQNIVFGCRKPVSGSAAEWLIFDRD